MPYKKRLSVRKYKVNYPGKTHVPREEEHVVVEEWSQCDSFASSLGYTCIKSGSLINYSIVCPRTDGTTSKFNDHRSIWNGYTIQVEYSWLATCWCFYLILDLIDIYLPLHHVIHSPSLQTFSKPTKSLTEECIAKLLSWSMKPPFRSRVDIISK